VLLLERHGETLFPDFARRLKCSACGSRNVEARPAWRNPIPRGTKVAKAEMRTDARRPFYAHAVGLTLAPPRSPISYSMLGWSTSCALAKVVSS
jgi:hypothetical protein